MADLIPYRSQDMVRQQRDQIEYIVEVIRAVQWETRHIYTEGVKTTVETLTYTTNRIQNAAENGASEAKVAALIAEQKEYLAEMRDLAANGASELASIVRNLPALPGSR